MKEISRKTRVEVKRNKSMHRDISEWETKNQLLRNLRTWENW
jgi:hypothetical protein